MKNYFKLGFDNIGWVEHAFFNRLGGVSEGDFASLNCGLDKGDDKEKVLENHKKVAEHFGVDVSNLLFLEQVHENTVITVDKLWTPDTRPKADAIVTDKQEVAIAVATADCTPVLLADKKKKVIGVVHAGWKSAFTGIIENTINAMEELGAKSFNIEAVIGPCISYRSYEVTSQYRDDFLKEHSENDKYFSPSPREGRYLFDLPRYTIDRIKNTGVKDIKNIDTDTLVNDKNFFSFRRNFLQSKSSYGVQPSVIMIKGK